MRKRDEDDKTLVNILKGNLFRDCYVDLLTENEPKQEIFRAKIILILSRLLPVKD